MPGNTRAQGADSWLQMNYTTKESLCLETVSLRPPLTPGTALQPQFLFSAAEKTLLTYAQSAAMLLHTMQWHRWTLNVPSPLPGFLPRTRSLPPHPCLLEELSLGCLRVAVCLRARAGAVRQLSEHLSSFNYCIFHSVIRQLEGSAMQQVEEPEALVACLQHAPGSSSAAPSCAQPAPWREVRSCSSPTPLETTSCCDTYWDVSLDASVWRSQLGDPQPWP